MMKPIISIHFPMVLSYRLTWMCTIYSTHTYTCEYGLTSQLAHHWAAFLVGQAYSGSSLGRTPVRTSNCHDNIRLNIMIVLLPDRRNIMINIMIVYHSHVVS